jgi:hypothetical protein
MKNLKKRGSSCEYHFLKTLFILSWCRITEEDSSGDLLSQSRMHIDEHDEIALVAQQRRKRKTRCIGSSWLFVVTSSVAAACIYREDSLRVTTSRNRLHLSLSKRIRYGLIVKINDKRRSRNYETLSRILVDYSHARCAPVPCHATPRHGRRGEASAHIFLSFSSSPHTCKCIESNSPYK